MSVICPDCRTEQPTTFEVPGLERIAKHDADGRRCAGSTRRIICRCEDDCDCMDREHAGEEADARHTAELVAHACAEDWA